MASNKKAHWENSKMLAVLGALLGSTAYFGNLMAWVTNQTLLLCLFAGAVSIGYGAYTMKKEEIEKLFKACKLTNEDIYPTVLDTHKDENTHTYIVDMPMGICQEDFEKKKQAFDQYFRGDTTFAFDNNLIINIRKNKFKKIYPFELHEYDEPLKFAVGYSKTGLYTIDMEEAIHLIVAGATGSGKSVLLRAIITALILGRHNIKIHLVDFMRVELGIFKTSNRIADFSCMPEEFSALLSALAVESDRRLKLFDGQGIVNIKSWNRKNPNNKLEYHIIIVDEIAALADKKYKKIMEQLKLRVAQDRKCGIHYILSTQRPSRDILDATIKANLPSRLCLKTASDSDSDIVLDVKGAEKLRGEGHALSKVGIAMTEIQTMYLSEDDAKELIAHTCQEKAETQEIADDTSGVIAL